MHKEFLKDETLSEKFINKWKWLYIFSFLIAPSGYIIKLLISNNLSVSDVGIIYSIISFVSILSNYNDLWFTESLKYFLPKFWINKKYDNFKTSIFLALTIQTFTAILIWLWLWFGADWLSINYFHSVSASIALKVFSLWFVIFNVFKTMDTIFISFQDTFVFKFIEFVRMWSIVIFVLIIFFSGIWSVLTYSLAWFLGTLVWLIISIVIYIKKYKKILNIGNIQYDKALNKQIFKYALWVIVASQWWILLWNIDQQMIIYFLWPEQAGYYTNYSSLLMIYSIFLWALFGFLFPITTELIEKKQNWKVSLMLSIFYKYFTVIWIYVWVFFAIFWPAIAFVLFGEKFIYSWELLKYWAWWIFLNILISINFSVLAGLWKIRQRAKIIWVAAIVNSILNFILLTKIWVVWAIISTIVWWFIMLILSYKEIKNADLSIKLDWKFLLKNIIVIWIIAIILQNIAETINFQDRLQIFRLIFIVGLLYSIIIIVVNWKSVKLFLKEIKKIKWN